MAENVHVYAARRFWLRRAVKEIWGGNRARAAEALGFKEASTVTRYMSDQASEKPIGFKVARKIELAAGYPKYQIDSMPFIPAEGQGEPPPANTSPLGVSSLDERINALPSALRQYVLMELELCESVKQLVPKDFIRPPTPKTRAAFQDYLRGLVPPGGKRNAA